MRTMIVYYHVKCGVVIAVITTAFSILVLSATGTSAARDGNSYQDERSRFFENFIATCSENAKSKKEESGCPDAALDACLEKFPSTHGQVACMGAGYDLWNERMEEALKDLEGKLSTVETAALKESQKNWREYAESRAAFEMEIFEGKGTMYQPRIAYSKMKAAKERALELERYVAEYSAG